ncbi:uncharacterized protein LOC131221486 isoform X2 [Magnolia sinica]|nr:uncharacterized protein LOC131221486 isoform X2 [Magnolia sinica]
MHQQSAQHALMSAGAKDADAGQVKAEAQQQQQNSSNDLNMEPATNFGVNKSLMNEISTYSVDGLVSISTVNLKLRKQKLHAFLQGRRRR